MTDAWERSIDESKRMSSEERKLGDSEQAFRENMWRVLETREGRQVMNYILALGRTDMYILGSDTQAVIARAAVHDYVVGIKSLMTREQLRAIEDSENE